MSVINEVNSHEIDLAIRKCIENVSHNPKYQLKLTILFVVVSLSTSLYVYSNSFFYMNPVFKCAGSNQKVFEDEACPKIELCQIVNTGTITAELNLYCGSRKKGRILVQSAGGIGNFFGLILACFSDRFGKKICFCAGIILLNLSWIFQMASVEYRSLNLLLMAQLLTGFCQKLCYIAFIVLLTRFMNKGSYELVTLIWFIVYHGVSQICISGITFAFEDWRAITYPYSVCVVVCSIASVIILKEDPLFLFHEDKISQVKNTIEEVGQQNGESYEVIRENTAVIYQLFQNKMQRIQNNLDRRHRYNIWDIVRCDIISKIILIGFAGCSYVLATRTIDLSIQSLQYSYSFNLLIVGVANVCGFTSAIYIIKVEQQRKRGYIYTSILYFLGAMLFLFPFCIENGSVQTCAIFYLRFCLGWICNFYTRLKVDLFPAKYQMTIVCLIEIIMAFGLIICPTLVQISIDHGLNAIAALAVVGLLIGTIPNFFLNQEKAHLLSDQTQELPAKNEKIPYEAFD